MCIPLPIYSQEIIFGPGTTGSVVKIRFPASNSTAAAVNIPSPGEAVQRTDPTKSDISVKVNISSMY